LMACAAVLLTCADSYAGPGPGFFASKFSVDVVVEALSEPPAY